MIPPLACSTNPKPALLHPDATGPAGHRGRRTQAATTPAPSARDCSPMAARSQTRVPCRCTATNVRPSGLKHRSSCVVPSGSSEPRVLLRRLRLQQADGPVADSDGQAVGGSIWGVARRGGRHSAVRRAVSAKARGEADRTSPHAIVLADMQTSLARRQRHRRLGIGRRPRGSSALKRTAIAIPIILVVAFIGAGRDGLARGRRRLQLLRQRASRTRRRPSPTSSSTSRRSSTTVPARSSLPASASASARSSSFDELTPEVLDATTAIEDKDFWINPGFDLGGLRCGDDRHDQRPATRRIDDHPAARPGPAPPAERLRGQSRGAEDPRDHPVDPADPGLSRRRRASS